MTPSDGNGGFIEFRGVTKRFPGVLAVDDVSFSISRGSCHALVGENGAGKSTLGRILAGVHAADEGEWRLDGRPVAPATPRDARALGVALVHQELAFCPDLTVAENLCLGDLPRRWLGWVDGRELRCRAERMLGAIGSRVDPAAPMRTLSTGQEQLVQIAAAVGSGARVIVFDEPTSSLSSVETQHLFDLVRSLRSKGITVVYISHRMEEIFALCDTVTVMRDGRPVGTGPVGGTTPRRVVEQMIGRELLVPSAAHFARPLGREVFRVGNLSSPGKFSNVGFSLREGEIVGMAGLVGAGRSEVAQAILGLDRRATGEMVAKGEPVRLGSIEDTLAAGIGLVPEDRKRQGLVLSLKCRENASLAALPLVSRMGWVRLPVERALVERHARRLRVKAPSLEVPAATLSGGNQQKIALAKWLARDCDILIVDEPTRGIDVGAKAEIYQLLDEMACEGKAVLVISSDMPELIGLCRRILVMRGGKLAGEVIGDERNETALIGMMAGLPV